MAIEIKKLTPTDALEYVHFFDTTPHDTNIDEHKCYCVCWASKDSRNEDFSTREKRRNLALDYVRTGKIQGYLAYDGSRLVGWCNANEKNKCLNSAAWLFMMKHLPEDEENLKIKSIFCYVISPNMKRKGIATSLLKKVCEDAKEEGFDYVEAYPYSDKGNLSSDFGGYLEMYINEGFFVHVDNEKGIVVRKKLK